MSMFVEAGPALARTAPRITQHSAPTRPAAERAAGRPLTRRIARGIAFALPIAVALAAVFGLGLGRVESDSMLPGLAAGDTVLFDRISSPSRSDVVVVHDVYGWASEHSGTIGVVDRMRTEGTATDALLVKRVVAIGGDRITCCALGDGRLMRNGEPLDEPYLVADARGGDAALPHAVGADSAHADAGAASRPGGTVPFDVTVPDGTVWVIGDNRGASRDSRTSRETAGHGAIPVDDVIGVVRWRLGPGFDAR